MFEVPNIFERSVLTAGAPRSSGACGVRLPAYERALGAQAGALVAEFRCAGLRGKGGAGFAVHRKAQMLLEQSVRIKHLVVNGSEHEPGSIKDRWLLEHHADTVLEGALCVAAAVGCTHVHFALNECSAAARLTLENAIESARQGPWPLPSLRVVAVPDVYIVGEETALLEVLEGRRPLPRGRPPYPIESGLGGEPTLIHNVETVAHIPYIVLFGADAHRSLGPNGKGATLCTFGDEFTNAGVRLVALGIRLRDVLDEAGGGLRSGLPIRAAQPGGPSSGYLHASQFDCLFDEESLAVAGSALGCAALRAYSHEDDMLAAAGSVLDFFEAACCGQCPSCRMETKMLAAIMRQLRVGKGSRKLLQQVPLIVKANVDKGICGLIRMPVAPIDTLLRHFTADVAACLDSTSTPTSRGSASSSSVAIPRSTERELS